jgi:hypothetical protein
MSIGSGSGGIGADAGEEVIDGAGDGIDGDARDSGPGLAIGGSAQHDVIAGAAAAETAIRPDDINLAGTVDGG